MSATAVPVENMKNDISLSTTAIPTQRAGNVQHGDGSLGSFLKAEPKTLGTVQIMIGAITFLFGTVLTVNINSFTVYSGIVYWGSLIYISAGSLTIGAEKKLNPCMVKASLGMNVVSAVAAGIAIILLCIDLALDPITFITLIQAEGTIGVLLVFSVLQCIISIFISAFGCKVLCNDETPLRSDIELRPEDSPPVYTENVN